MIEVEEFRAEVRDWLAANLVGEFAALKGLGAPGREDEAFEERRAWNQRLAAAGLTCLGWPVEHGGRGRSVAHRVAFYEEYARADAPHKVNHFGEELLGPTLIAFGTEEQKKRFLPTILDVTELWCQGYSEPGDGWRVAMGTLTFERGVSTLGQQIRYARELSNLVEVAKRTGADDDPLIRERLTRSWVGLQTMRSYALATMDVEQPGQDSVSKLLWANWHRDLGELAMDIVGKAGLVAKDGEFDVWQHLYLFTRADTIYGGSNEIQRNIIAERVLGLPREVKG